MKIESWKLKLTLKNMSKLRTQNSKLGSTNTIYCQSWTELWGQPRPDCHRERAMPVLKVFSLLGSCCWLFFVLDDFWYCWICFRRQLDHPLMLQQVQTQVLQRSRWSFQINDTHSLVKDWKYCAHQVVSIVQSLNFLPLGLCLTSFNRVCFHLLYLIGGLFFIYTSFNLLNFMESLHFCVFVLFDEVLRL